MDNKDIDSLYANLQDEIKKILEDWWQKIKWNVENAAAASAQTATSSPTRRGGSLPWFGHGVRGFLHKLWYGDHPENPNWQAMPATENSKKRMTIQEYSNLKEQLEDWIDIFSENDLISATKNDLLNSLLGAVSKYMNQAYQLGYARNPSPAAATAAEPANSEPVAPKAEPAQPTAASEPPVASSAPEPPAVDTAAPPQGTAADMPRRGRGRPALSPEELARRKLLKKQTNKRVPDPMPMPEPDPEAGFDAPEKQAKPSAPVDAAEPATTSDQSSEMAAKIQEVLPFFGNLKREPEQEKIKNRQQLYDQLGLEHDAGQIRSKPDYIPILGDIIYGMINNEYLEKKFWNSGERYKRIFGPLNGKMIDKIINYVEKKMESEENPQTNANLSGFAANSPNESLKQTVNRYKNLLKENKKSTLTIVKARHLTKDEKLSYFKESLR